MSMAQACSQFLSVQALHLVNRASCSSSYEIFTKTKTYRINNSYFCVNLFCNAV